MYYRIEKPIKLFYSVNPIWKEEEGFVLLPDPFGVVDRSGETRSIDLLVPGATQSIEWKVDDEFHLFIQ